jgi:hypothetical protein
MLKSREYIGLSLEGDFIKIVRLKLHKKGLKLVRLDKLKLIEPLKSKKKEVKQEIVESEDIFADDDSDSIFGLDDELDMDESSDTIEEIDLSDIGGADDLADVDLTQEASAARNNQELLVNYLDDFKKQKVNLGLNIEIGNTIFQIFKDLNYKELKKKEAKQNIYGKLEAIYGEPPSEDYFDYYIRENGNLVLASVDEESKILRLVNQASDSYDRNYYVSDVIPDEAAMVGLYKTHYKEERAKISGLIQFGPDKCRMIFVQGHDILQVSPVINEGTGTKNFLNTIFSKILFQLDTGEIPGVDRFILYNNSVGDSAVEFFKKNFPDLVCENFRFNEELLSYEDSIDPIVQDFTTAIGVATKSTGTADKFYPELSFLPEYVSDKQKIFKLHWHGFLLLILIGASPVILNHFYQKYSAQIDQLESQTNRLQMQLNEIRPLVEESEMLSAQLSQMQAQLGLLTELSRDNIRWTVTLDRFNRAVEEVGGLWINSFRQNNDVIMVDGYSLTRERIPQLANQFPNVTLLSVRREEIRERDIFYFNFMIRRVVEDESQFTPSEAREIENLINQ